MNKLFFKQPKSTNVFPKGNYVVQKKYDGERMFFIDKGIQGVLLNRRGVNKNKQFPEFNSLARRLPGNNIIDGEMVVFKKPGMESFNLLSQRTHLKHNIVQKQKQLPATFMAFDIVNFHNKDIRNEQLNYRLKQLHKLPTNSQFQIVKTYPASKARNIMQPTYVEGVVFKDPNSTYQNTKDDSWLKYKKAHEADLVVTGYEKGKGTRQGSIGAVTLGVWDGSHIRDVGRSGSFMMPQSDLKQWKQKLDKQKIDEHNKVVTVHPHYFAKVQYSSKGAQGGLREPRVMGFRTDIGIKNTHLSKPITDNQTQNLSVLGRLANKAIMNRSIHKTDMYTTYSKSPYGHSDIINVHMKPILEDVRTTTGTQMYKTSPENLDELQEQINYRRQYKRDLPLLANDLQTRNKWGTKTNYPIFDYPESYGYKATKVTLPAREVINLMTEGKDDPEEFAKRAWRAPGDESKTILIDGRRQYDWEGLNNAILSPTKEVGPVGIELKEGKEPFFEGRHRAVWGLQHNQPVPVVIIRPQPVLDAYTENKKSSKDIRNMAYKVKNTLTPYSNKIEIAGSIRRGENPKDVDIVLVPKDKQAIKDKMLKLGAKIRAEGKTLLYLNLNGVHVDLFFAEKDSFGAQMMTRTGPAGGNIGNRTLAKRKGMILNQYGLFKGNKRIAGRSEKGIYEALGKHYKEPELRGK